MRRSCLSNDKDPWGWYSKHLPILWTLRKRPLEREQWNVGETAEVAITATWYFRWIKKGQLPLDWTWLIERCQDEARAWWHWANRRPLAPSYLLVIGCRLNDVWPIETDHHSCRRLRRADVPNASGDEATVFFFFRGNLIGRGEFQRSILAPSFISINTSFVYGTCCLVRSSGDPLNERTQWRHFSNNLTVNDGDLRKLFWIITMMAGNEARNAPMDLKEFREFQIFTRAQDFYK